MTLGEAGWMSTRLRGRGRGRWIQDALEPESVPPLPSSLPQMRPTFHPLKATKADDLPPSLVPGAVSSTMEVQDFWFDWNCANERVPCVPFC